ncbi:uncharacterized protein LOC142814250 isoform X3 [Rhipicephalus microplus]|uniref:uncharacterized protein LOC142814250 isoform X3 n=1 Tax=Rhipicephalus microplus TaxID=6941 RepID=UPI003F6D15BF
MVETMVQPPVKTQKSIYHQTMKTTLVTTAKVTTESDPAIVDQTSSEEAATSYLYAVCCVCVNKSSVVQVLQAADFSCSE